MSEFDNETYAQVWDKESGEKVTILRVDFDARRHSQAPPQEFDLAEVVGEATAEKLEGAGFVDAGSILAADEDDLVDVEGVGPATAAKARKAASRFVEGEG